MLVPAKIDPVEPPLGFGLIQAADLTGWDSDAHHAEFQGFLTAISDVVGPLPKPENGDQVSDISESSLEQPSEAPHEEGEIPQSISRQPASAAVGPSESQADSTAASEPKLTGSMVPGYHKTGNVVKFGILVGLALLLIAGIWWFVSQQPVREVRQEIENFNRQALNLEKAIAELSKPEEIEEFTRQKDALSLQVESLGEQATKFGLESQLTKLQDHLNQARIQLGNKEKELIAARRDKETAPITLTVSHQLRSEPRTVPSEEAHKTFGLYKNWRPAKYIENQFEDRGKVVSDRATGLMWQKSGSQIYLTYEKAQEYIEQLNREGFAGHSDWRLPTIPELMSLLEIQKLTNGLYIDPIFDANYYSQWSADKRSSGSAWIVNFYSGRVGWVDLINDLYVRGVRS